MNSKKSQEIGMTFMVHRSVTTQSCWNCRIRFPVCDCYCRHFELWHQLSPNCSGQRSGHRQKYYGSRNDVSYQHRLQPNLRCNCDGIAFITLCDPQAYKQASGFACRILQICICLDMGYYRAQYAERPAPLWRRCLPASFQNRSIANPGKVVHRIRL